MFCCIVWDRKEDPFSAITVYGPFGTEAECREFANKNFGVYWRLGRLVGHGLRSMKLTHCSPR